MHGLYDEDGTSNDRPLRRASTIPCEGIVRAVSPPQEGVLVQRRHPTEEEEKNDEGSGRQRGGRLPDVTTGADNNRRGQRRGGEEAGEDPVREASHEEG